MPIIMRAEKSRVRVRVDIFICPQREIDNAPLFFFEQFAVWGISCFLFEITGTNCVSSIRIEKQIVQSNC